MNARENDNLEIQVSEDQFKASIPTSLPKVIRENVEKAISFLTLAAIGIPLQFFRQKSERIAMQTEAERKMMDAFVLAGTNYARTDPEIGKRALQHFLGKEIRGQANREAVLTYALDDLKEIPPTNDAPISIDEDWLSYFAEVAEKKSHTDMQKVLARILAGEIQSPGSFSPSSIFATTMLTRETAEIFRNLCCLSSLFYENEKAHGSVVVITNHLGKSGNNLIEFGLPDISLLELARLGLLSTKLEGTFGPSIDELLYKFQFDLAGRTINLNLSSPHRQLATSWW